MQGRGGGCGKNEGEYNPPSSVITLPGNQGFLDLATVLFPRIKKKKEEEGEEGKALSSTFAKMNLPLMIYCMLSSKQSIINYKKDLRVDRVGLI